MIEPHQRSVFFVGQQRSLDETLSNVSLGSDICTRALGPGENVDDLFSETACDLLVFDFDGDIDGVLDLLTKLGQLLPRTPKLALVDRGDVPAAVQATRAGAANCLEKPVGTARLRSEIETLLGQVTDDPIPLISELTPMERIVLRHILAGQTNGQTAKALHRSPRTIEIHRRNIMGKLGVTNTVELVKAAISSGFLEDGQPKSLSIRPDILRASTG